MIELTEQQRQAVKQGETVRLSVPELGEEVVVLRAHVYDETIQRLLDDEREQKAVLAFAMKQAAKVARENPY
jgi:hypothetical protein